MKEEDVFLEHEDLTLNNFGEEEEPDEQDNQNECDAVSVSNRLSQQYSLELHDRSRHDGYFKQLLDDDNFEVDSPDIKQVFAVPIGERLYSQAEYRQMNESGHIPYLKKCAELQVVCQFYLDSLRLF
jgi:hypothetical protein